MICWPRDMLKFEFLEKGLELIAPLLFVYDFSRKTFIMLYSINWSNFILFHGIKSHICIVIICFPGYDVINFVINASFLSTWPKMQDKDLHILKTKRASKMKQKGFFIICKGVSIARNCLRQESAPLSHFALVFAEYVIRTKVN